MSVLSRQIMHGRRQAARLAFVAIVVSVATPSLSAQDDSWATLGEVYFVQVKPEMVSEWEALQKEWVAEMKKAGAKRGRYIHQTVVGKTWEYIIVGLRENYAELDSPEIVGTERWRDNWLSRIRRCIDSREVEIYEIMKDHSNPWPDVSPMFANVFLNAVEGKTDELDDLVKNEWTPLRKKLGLSGPVLYRPVYGDVSRRTRILAFPMSDWAASDEPNEFVAKGGDDARAIGERLLSLVADNKWIVRRHRPDLSYVPE